ncbi:hypothetical protein [Paraburkholderia adhaesiva]|uniref:hypothetical protein n=1 Tax=Paraburkholderia adhaesiva TaxID=2883244 RepID=UPI001F224702|nr:hypothetical protein [Paraburkholderia adhaesiva]
MNVLLELRAWLRGGGLDPVDDERVARWSEALDLRLDLDRDAARVFASILSRPDLPADLRNDLGLLQVALAGPRGEV